MSSSPLSPRISHRLRQLRSHLWRSCAIGQPCSQAATSSSLHRYIPARVCSSFVVVTSQDDIESHRLVLYLEIAGFHRIHFSTAVLQGYCRRQTVSPTISAHPASRTSLSDMKSPARSGVTDTVALTLASRHTIPDTSVSFLERIVAVTSP